MRFVSSAVASFRPMRNTSSALVGSGLALALVIATGCGGGSTRSGYDEQQQETAGTDPNADPQGGPAGGFGGDPSQNVTLEPKNTTVIIDSATTPATPGTAAFKVMQNGADITASAKFTLKDASLGAFNGAKFTSVAALPAGVLGKSTTVQVATDKGQALGTLTVVQLRKTGEQRDFFFVVPFGEDPSPKNDVLKFSTNIKQADVAFVMDTTGSMASAIDNLKNALQGTLMAQLQAAIPNVGLAVVDYKDFGDPWVVKVNQVVTTNLGLAKAGVAAMSATGGGDTPEAAIAAMQYTLLGQANNGIAAHSNTTPGTFGGVDFRPGSIPVVVNITDAEWHDASGNATMASLKGAFTANKAKFVNIAESGLSIFGGGPEAQANDLSDATGSNVPPSAFGAVAGCSAGQCCTGNGGAGRAVTAGGMCRLNFLSQSGNGVSGGIVKAIEAIAVGSTFDVKAIPSNDPKNAKAVDATKFIKALRAMDEGNPANNCPAAPAKDSDGDGIKDTFIAVKAGTPVCFEVIPAKNTIVSPELDPQFFNAFVDVIAVQGNLHLDKRSVLFLVPPKDAGVK
jgi:hypothetical protein